MKVAVYLLSYIMSVTTLAIRDLTIVDEDGTIISTPDPNVYEYKQIKLNPNHPPKNVVGTPNT